MEPQEILSHLDAKNEDFPREALSLAEQYREEITPELLKILENACEHLEQLVETDSLSHFYALYLLAQFREVRAYSVIVRLFSEPGELSLDVYGDVVTEDLGRILASVCGGDTTLICELVENESANVYTRLAAMSGLVVLVASGVKTREEVMAYFRNLFLGGLARNQLVVWAGLVCACLDLYPEEAYHEIRQAFDEGLVDLDWIGFESVVKSMKNGKQAALEALERDIKSAMMKDAVVEMGWLDQDASKNRPSFRKKAETPTAGKLARKKKKAKKKRKQAKTSRRKNF